MSRGHVRAEKIDNAEVRDDKRQADCRVDCADAFVLVFNKKNNVFGNERKRREYRQHHQYPDSRIAAFCPAERNAVEPSLNFARMFEISEKAVPLRHARFAYVIGHVKRRNQKQYRAQTEQRVCHYKRNNIAVVNRRFRLLLKSRLLRARLFRRRDGRDLFGVLFVRACGRGRALDRLGRLLLCLCGRFLDCGRLLLDCGRSDCDLFWFDGHRLDDGNGLLLYTAIDGGRLLFGLRIDRFIFRLFFSRGLFCRRRDRLFGRGRLARGGLFCRGRFSR